jgi:hypothetical protein
LPSVETSTAAAVSRSLPPDRPLAIDSTATWLSNTSVTRSGIAAFCVDAKNAAESPSKAN